jgi:hypothetical protein
MSSLRPFNLGQTEYMGSVFVLRCTYLLYYGKANRLLPGYSPTLECQLDRFEGVSEVRFLCNASRLKFQLYPPSGAFTRELRRMVLHLGQSTRFFSSELIALYPLLVLIVLAELRIALSYWKDSWWY